MLTEINWYDDDTGFTNEYWFQWRGYDGVLSGFGISSSTGTDADFVRIGTFGTTCRTVSSSPTALLSLQNDRAVKRDETGSLP